MDRQGHGGHKRGNHKPAASPRGAFALLEKNEYKTNKCGSKRKSETKHLDSWEV